MTPRSEKSQYLRFDILDDLEAALGNPRDPENLMGFDVLGAQDRSDEFPSHAIDLLNRLGIADFYVPDADGGRLTDYLEPFWLIRTLARRSITLAVAHGKTFLGTATAWVGANEQQRERVSELVRSGTPISWGLTERDHGSDLLAGEVEVTDGRLNGSKWLINNATRGGAIVVIARTSAGGGPRGFDLVLVVKSIAETSDSDPGFRHLPKELTHGIRGADISGIEFVDFPVDEQSIISKPGHGLENVMKALQLTRTLCCSLSLGATDRALHNAVRFAEERRLYNRTLIELPQAQRILSDAFADHLLNEAMAIAVVRSIHTLPQELSVHAPAAKYFIPTRTESALASLRGFMGARAFLDPSSNGEPPLSRIERDHRIVSLFDGNTVVNLTSLIMQFPFMNRPDLPAESAKIVAEAPTPNLSRLSLLSRGGSTMLRMLADAVDQLCELNPPEDVCSASIELVGAARQILQEVTTVHWNPTEMPDSNFALAERLSCVIAGTSALHVYLTYAGTIDSPLWGDALWLRLALPRILAMLNLDAPTTGTTADHEAATAVLRQLASTDQGFSLLTVAITGGFE
ncbi:acyl-CoA dehydrogenase family protein [Mycobacterium montefiorense]|uniref:acyl-CoA dehydrogenase family protein n=1 Tax=Mycobacterium montefiorense TaxID=154654 RepID=UPI0021DE8762|nr:acyl-CoA dehydrogenase [Mycobacterium montefiorense]GLE51748.1 putative acyl-CoA dehydrogenase [Mycobacterium montefiorense]